MQLLYHPDNTISKISTPDLKKLNINFSTWYCPIHTFVWLIRHDGTIKSGTCGQNMFYNHQSPFWDNEPRIENTDSYCKVKRGACGCGSDLNSPKAISTEVYQSFFKKINELGKDAGKNAPLYNGKSIIGIGALHKILNGTAEIHIDIGKKCNFDCSYCPPGVHDNHSPFLTLENIDQALNIVEHHSRLLENKTCIITGGEPTLFKDLENLIKMLKVKNFKKIKINTNGTASYKTYSNLIKDYSVELDITFHYEFTTEKIVEKCNQLSIDFPKEVKLKLLSKSKDFINTVNLITTDYEQFPIYEKTESKQTLK